MHRIEGLDCIAFISVAPWFYPSVKQECERLSLPAMTEADDHVALAVRQASGVHSVLGIRWRGPVALVTCILPTRQTNNVRSCMAKASQATFTKRSDIAVTTMSRRLDSGLPDGYVDAAQILRERGYNEVHVWRMAGEFGRDCNCWYKTSLFEPLRLQATDLAKKRCVSTIALMILD